MSPADTELQAWALSAARWTRHADEIEAITAEATQGLLARLKPQPGERILDVAAGTGDPALALAVLVGPSGHVLASDGVADMLEELRRRARDRGLANIATLHAAAERLTLPEASFDAACSRFGVMFFGDPQAALANVRRALRPGGRIVLAAWGERERNPYFGIPLQALEESLVPDPAPPDARTVFECAEGGRLAGVLERAGWREVREERAAVRLRLAGVGPEAFLETVAGISRKLADRLEPLAPAAREALRVLVARRAATHAQAGGLVFPAEVVYASGRA